MLKSTGSIPKNVYPPPQKKKLNNYFKRIMYHGVIYLIMYNSYQLHLYHVLYYFTATEYQEFFSTQNIYEL